MTTRSRDAWRVLTSRAEMIEVVVRISERLTTLVGESDGEEAPVAALAATLDVPAPRKLRQCTLDRPLAALNISLACPMASVTSFPSASWRRSLSETLPYPG